MSRPRIQHQGPATNCIIHGRELGWLSCTSFGCAMCADAATNGRVRPDGCSLREATGDTIGGLMLSQMVGPLAELGVKIELHVGANVCSPSYAARKLVGRRPVALQGNTGALLGTPFKDADGEINHLVAIIEVRGGTSDEPAEALVYDPAADGRHPGIANGPQWWPWDRVLKFAARLHPNGEDDPRVLGPGKFYCAIFPAPPVVLPDTGTSPYRVRIAHNATVRIYKLKGKGRSACIDTWVDSPWTAAASGAPCEQPIHRSTCNKKSGATTVRITAGKFKNKYVRIGTGVTLIGG